MCITECWGVVRLFVVLRNYKAFFFFSENFNKNLKLFIPLAVRRSGPTGNLIMVYTCIQCREAGRGVARAYFGRAHRGRGKKNIEHLHRLCNCSSVNSFCLFSSEFPSPRSALPPPIHGINFPPITRHLASPLPPQQILPARPLAGV